MNPLTMLPFLPAGTVVPNAPPPEPSAQTHPLLWLGVFAATVAPAAVLGAVAGSYLAEVTPKQRHYAKVGAVGGVVALALAMVVVVSKDQAVAT